MSLAQLKDYIEDCNRWRRATKRPEITFPLTQDSVNYIAENLDCQMSTENLHCDGEISVAEANRKARRYQGAFNTLSKYVQDHGLDMPKTYEIY